jgi:hypothetical protein
MEILETAIPLPNARNTLCQIPKSWSVGGRRMSSSLLGMLKSIVAIMSRHFDDAKSLYR